MPSFDVVCKLAMQEVDNAVHQTERELAQRFDFRAVKTEIRREDFVLHVHSADDFKVRAVVEILRTALAYFTEGRVKVTYIIDTVMVTVLTEVMAFWHREMAWQQLAMVIALVLSLACIRIIAVRFSPRRLQHEL